MTQANDKELREAREQVRSIERTLSEKLGETSPNDALLAEKAGELQRLKAELAHIQTRAAEIKDQINNIESEVQAAHRKAIVDYVTVNAIDPTALAVALGLRLETNTPTPPTVTFKTKEADPKIKNPSPPKYFNPANPSQEWSGRGAEPEWATPYNITPKGETRRKYKDEIDIKNKAPQGV